MKRTLLLDGDVFIYKAAASSEQEITFSPEVTCLQTNLEEAKNKIHAEIDLTMKALKGDDVIIALSDPHRGYWRKSILPTYKSHRRDVRKPIGLKTLVAWIETQYVVKSKPFLEGDDVLGILSTHPTLVPGEKVIVSVDKDMKTIPGLFCRNLDGNTDIEEISERQADYFHMWQTLTGDTTDGYAGCPGTGAVKATKILDIIYATCDWAEAWPAVLATFKKAGLSEIEALTQARVARICRHMDYDFTKQEPILWNPPTTKGTT